MKKVKIQTIKKILLLIFILCSGKLICQTNYYVSNDGDNSNNGTSKETPWETIAKVNSVTLSPGDSVLFKCGDTWRGESIEAKHSGTSDAYLTYGSYGTGKKPRILGSEEIKTWIATGVANAWKGDVSINNPWTVVTATGTNCQVFFIEKDESVTWGYYKEYDASFTNLTTNYDWTWNNSSLYIYSDSDPNTQYNGVEAPQLEYTAIINYKEYISFNNLELAFIGGHGIRDAYGPRNLFGLKVTNMHIHHIGRKGSNVAYGTYTYHSDSYFAYNTIHDCGRRGISIAAVNFSPSMLVVELNRPTGGGF